MNLEDLNQIREIIKPIDEKVMAIDKKLDKFEDRMEKDHDSITKLQAHHEFIEKEIEGQKSFGRRHAESIKGNESKIDEAEKKIDTLMNEYRNNKEQEDKQKIKNQVFRITF